jgi:NAD+ kinase
VPASSRSEQEAQQTEEEEEEDDDDGEENAENGGLSRVEPIGENGDGNGGELKGDMCASTTGVVRVQSRRKAEMYLVRTDGFSCTRERVKESTLAFTHPSTQQQMLMWKTSPKTVLLLKKLGSELMEEAQQVSSSTNHNTKLSCALLFLL